ncbi:hypothetical protein [Streptomyces sp. NPDC005953]|uniref:HAAS signaling domain-containing protein n=1 Tax=Streptomyces sp. NPDC005953 TaxID=3156719 RepID=UPI0033E4A52D
MTLRRDQLVDDYLHRFDNASVFLAGDRRAELRQEIVEHIDIGLEEADAQHIEAVRGVLERLGPPADIVAAELADRGSTGSTPVVTPTDPPVEVAAEEPIEQAARQAQDDKEGPPAPAPASVSRGRVFLLTGLTIAVLMAGFVVFGLAMAESGHPQESPAYLEPAISSSEGALPSEWPSDGSIEPTSPPLDGFFEPSGAASAPTF